MSTPTGNAQTYLQIARQLMQPGPNERAKAYYTECVRINPNTPEAWLEVASIHEAQGEDNLAQQCYRNVIALLPQHPVGYMQLANNLLLNQQAQEALVLYQQVATSAPNEPGLANNMGGALEGLGRFDEAESWYRKAMAANPNDLDARFNLGLLYLRLGQFQAGWPLYECRLINNPRLSPKRPDTPQWDGTDLAGKRILVIGEQGYGDSLQFLRFLPLVKAKGGIVLYETPKALRRLLCGIEGVDEFIPRVEGCPSDVVHDVHIYLMSLPMLFNTTVDNLPPLQGFPDLTKPSEPRPWQALLKNDRTFKVGIAWAGNPTNKRGLFRGCDVSHFQALAGIPNLTFYGLQKNADVQSLETLEAHLNFIDLAPALLDFADTAAVVQQLDLVITIDCVVAHLAGILNRPAWVILNYNADWRWMAQRDDSPWYPTLKLFRQEASQDWETVFAAMKDELLNLLVG